MRKLLVVAGLMGLFLVPAWLLTGTKEPTPYHMPSQTMESDPVQPTPECLEGQRCWDCGSMGNMICGTFDLAKASADRCGGTVYYHKERMYTTVCPV